MKIEISDIRKLAKSAWGTKNRADSIDLIIDKLEELDNKCPHNVMVRNEDDLIYAWKCADCGYVYGKK